MSKKDKNNVDIFICTHKDFKPFVSSPVYQIADNRLFKNKYKIFGKLDDVELSELYTYFFINEYAPLKKYVGFCHYRRYYEFLDDVPDFDEIFKEYDIVTVKPFIFDFNCLEQYAYCHNVEDVYILENVIKEHFSEYYDSFKKFFEGNAIIPCNMFIMKKKDFKKYVNFLKEVMKEFFWVYGIEPKQKVLDNKEKYLKDFYPSNDIDYQSRTFSYLMERLTNVFIIKHFSKIKTYKTILTEDKYNQYTNIEQHK